MLPADQLAQQFLERHPEAAAEVLAGLLPVEQARAMENLEISSAVALLLRLPAVTVARTLHHLDPVRVAALLSALPLRNVADILRRVPLAERERYLSELSPRTVSAIRAAIERAQDSIAVLMDRQVLSFPLESTVEQVLQRLDREPDESGYHIYITAHDGRFVGVLTVRQLYAAHPHLRVGSLSLQALTALPEGARSSSVIGHPAWLRHPRLPVIDANGCFVGVLRRERLTERGVESLQASGGLLGAGLALMEGYATANAVLLELLMRGSIRR
ncbi:MAG: CBS domain-containing protein [Gammaproteobacteria bacterium]|nr:CBS domain-containing protein [Gammaproteobacteria bacterium]